MILSLIASALVGCNDAGKKGPDDATQKIAVSAADSAKQGRAQGASAQGGAAAAGEVPAAVASGKRFAYESGVVEMKSMSIPGMVATFYFDEYGEKIATVTDIKDSINGQPITIRNVNVLRDGESILYDPLKKVGMKNKVLDGTANYFPVFATLSDSQRQAINYRKLEGRSIIGKACEGHEFARNGMPVSVWTWGGVPLRTELNYGNGQAHVMEATSIKLDAPMPENIFVVPADVNVKEVTTPTLQ